MGAAEVLGTLERLILAPVDLPPARHSLVVTSGQLECTLRYHGSFLVAPVQGNLPPGLLPLRVERSCSHVSSDHSP